MEGQMQPSTVGSYYISITEPLFYMCDYHLIPYVFLLHRSMIPFAMACNFICFIFTVVSSVSSICILITVNFNYVPFLTFLGYLVDYLVLSLLCSSLWIRLYSLLIYNIAHSHLYGHGHEHVYGFVRSPFQSIEYYLWCSCEY